MTTYEPFIHKYLDPASRLGEVIFGLIMVLSVTLTAGFTAAEGSVGVRQLLFAALGCNVAWGIIDGVMFVMTSMVARGEKALVIHAVQSAPNEQAALDIVRNIIEPRFDALARLGRLEAQRRSIFEYFSQAEAPKTRVTMDDLYGAVACFLLVFITCLPAAVPFLIFSEPTLALRLSNAFLVLMLFVVGYVWAQYAYTNRVLAGVVMVSIGLALVGVAVLLGG
jgi:hypothetical protein